MRAAAAFEPGDRRLATPDAEDQLDSGPDVRVAELAAEHWGVLSTGELRAGGLSFNAITFRARNGRLHRLHRGVYAVGHRNVPLQGRFRLAREDDAERQALLDAHGERVLRVAWSQAITRRAETLERIRAAGAPT